VTPSNRDEPRVLLSVNVGSSSLKVAVFRCGAGTEEVLARIEASVGEQGFEIALDRTLDAVGEGKLPAPDAVGHRVVHGGLHHSGPAVLTPAVRDGLRDLIPLAPLHQPAALIAIDHTTVRFPGIPQVACFDTSFHRRMPELAQRFALPAPLWTEGVRRYGFHGISYSYVVEELGPDLAGRAVIAHLGNGASMVALHDGEPRDTTMGLTPTGGLVMGTRTGDLDPGVLIYLARKHDCGADELEAMVNTKGGLLGLSGSTSDMQELLDARAGDPAAAVAVDEFCYTARKEIGSLAAVLGGIETLVFTGGIGEHAAPVREQICAGLYHLGIRIDSEANARHEPVISATDGRATVRIFPTDEDRMIARSTARLLSL
jgi:acetate kinase